MERSLYLAALVALLPPLAGRFRPRLGRVATGPWWPALAVGCILASLGLGAARLGRLPLDGFLHGMGALALWLVVGWLVLRRRPRMAPTGAAFLGLAVALLAVGVLAGGGERPPDEERLRSVWFPLHVLLMLAGFSGFAISFVLSALYLFVRRRLKLRRLRGIRRLPSLDTLDRLNTQAMGLGFVALTAGMVVGGLWARSRPGRAVGPDVTTYATIAVWLWYAAGLHVRLVAGWRGRLAAIFGVVGFAGLVALMGVAAAMLGGWHGFGE